jgi:hypothetical protein
VFFGGTVNTLDMSGMDHQRNAAFRQGPGQLKGVGSTWESNSLLDVMVVVQTFLKLRPAYEQIRQRPVRKTLTSLQLKARTRQRSKQAISAAGGESLTSKTEALTLRVI